MKRNKGRSRPTDVRKQKWVPVRAEQAALPADKKRMPVFRFPVN